MARFGFLSSYPPTRCGLATFTDSLAASIVQPGDRAFVVRVVEHPETAAPVGGAAPVAAHLIHGDPRSVAAAARALNGGDVAIVQHEYGIYGGPDGDQVLEVTAALTVPVVAVLHTVLNDPTPGQKRVLEEVVRRATSAVVMTQAARTLLLRHFDIDAGKVTVIPHGVHPLPPTPATRARRPTVLTWGLIGPGKGIEWGVQALAHLHDLAPRPLYRVVGQTHPKVLARFGDAYRDHLHAVVETLGLGGHVELDDRYQTPADLARSLGEADVVLLPYDNATQVTSGVLQEAVAAGKPVVATEFPHAVEVLAEGCGVVVPHRNPAAIARALRQILTRADVAARMAETARQISRETSWTAVGARYRRLGLGLRAGTVAA